MKRKNRSKLSLHRETLHALEGPGLRRAAGGITVIPSCRNVGCSGNPECPSDAPTCPYSCQATCATECFTDLPQCTLGTGTTATIGTATGTE